MSNTNEPTTDSLERKIVELTVLTGKEFMKTKVLNDWTLAKDIMKLVREDRQELIARVEREVIGRREDDKKYSDLSPYARRKVMIEYDLRAEQRQALNKLKDSETGDTHGQATN